MAHEKGFRKLFSNTFERRVFNKLETWFRKDGGKVVHNCAMPWENGNVTEADVIMVLRSGIYVLECKRWHGVITNEGSQYHKYIPHADREDYDARCENPFWQNYLHIKCLKKLLKREAGIKGMPIFSLAVFPDECSIEGIDPGYSNNYPVQISKSMIQTIKRIDSIHPPVFSTQQLNDIYELLKLYEPQSKEERLSNVTRIRQQRKISYENNRNIRVCF